LPPHDQRRGPVPPQPGLPRAIARDVGAVVVEEVGLDVGLARPAQKRELIRPEVWIVARDVRAGAHVPQSRRREGQEVLPQRHFVKLPVGPEGAPRRPQRAQAILVGHGVLDDERVEPLGMRQHHAESDGPAVVLEVERVARQTQGLREAHHHLGDAIERVGEVLRVRRIAVAKAGVVRRDEVELPAESRQERLVHARRRREAVQEQERRRAGAPGLAIEDRQAIHGDAAVGDRRRADGAGTSARGHFAAGFFGAAGCGPIGASVASTS
jgi:hypothetical protein